MIGIRVGEDLQVKSVVGRRRQVGELFVAIGLLVGDPEVQLHGVPGLGLVVVRHADGGVRTGHRGSSAGAWCCSFSMEARRQPFDCDRGS
jgi:hypothetical protein